MAREPAEVPLRVLHLITDLGKGGAERFLLDLCRTLMGRSEVKIVIGTLFDNDEYAEYTADLPIVQLQYVPFSFRGGNNYSEYKDLLDSFNPNIIHTHRFLAEFLSGQHVSQSVAYVCHGHDNMVQFANPRPRTWLDRGGLNNWLEKRYLIRYKYRRVRTTFVANSAHTLDYYQTVLPRFMRRDVQLIPCGFDYERFRTRQGRRVGEDGPVRLVNVGSFQDKKNQIFIVAIAEALREAGIDFEVHLLGDGTNRAPVQDAVDRLGLSDRITFHGNVDRVEEWLWRCHLYLHTAWYEPFGLALLEAMAAGLPCIVLDGKGNRDLIAEGKNGFLIQKEDPQEFVARIQELSTSPQLYETMSAFAKEYAKHFDMEHVANRFVDLYRQRAVQGAAGGE